MSGQKKDIQQIMHGLSDQSAVRDKDQIYLNTVEFPSLSSSRNATLMLPDSVKSVRVFDDHVLLTAKAVYMREEYTYRYFDYRPVFSPRSNTSTIQIRIGFCGGNTVRVTAWPGFREPKTQTQMLVKEPDFEAVTVDETEHELRISNGKIRAVIQKQPWNLYLEDPDGNCFYRQFGRDGHSFVSYEICPFGFLIDGDQGEVYACESVEKDIYEHIYGLGENFSAIDRDGRSFRLWNTNALGVNTDRGYKNIPFYHSTQGYAAFYNTSRKVCFDMGKTLSKANWITVGGETLDYFVIRGETVRERLGRYLDLTGRPGMPPKWSFGLWMSKISYGTQEEVETVARRLRQGKIPCDVIHVDTDWFAEDWVCDWRVDQKKFPDFPGMIQNLHRNGYHLSLWQLPYIERGNISTEVYEEGMAHGYFASNPDGNMKFPHGLIDFSNPEAVEWYQQKLLRPLLEMGVDVIKADFGESAPPFFQYAGAGGQEMHNLYALLYNRAVYEITKEVHGEKDALIWARSAWAGSQRYPLHWGGDAGTDFASMANSIKGSLSLGMSGFPFWSSDIGGFWFESDPVLYIRWSQYGMFCSHARLHGFYTREPWDFGEQALEIFRKYANLRYRLMPYIYLQAKKAVDDGLPMNRALVIDYPDDPAVSSIDTQYLFGESILVCPVLNREGIVKIYLPYGTWTDFHTNRRHEGGKWMRIKAELEDMPLFIRENAIIPMGPEMSYVDEKETDPVTLLLYPVSGESRCDLEGMEISMNALPERITLGISPCSHNLILSFINVSSTHCTLNGEEISAERKTDSLLIRLDKNIVKNGITLILEKDGA